MQLKCLSWRSDYFYDHKEAKRAVVFAESQLQHIKGEFAGSRFILQAWQRRIMRRIFGWKRRVDGTRKYRKVYIFVPRKNGKTFFGAAIGMYLLFADREPGAEVVSAAADTEQAGIIYEVIKENVLRNSTLSELVGKPFRRSVAVQSTASSYKVLSSAANTKHGSNLHGILIDELHAQPNRELVDVLTTSVGSRRQSLTVYLTTAGFDKKTICGEVHDYACKVRDGVIIDEEFMPVLYGADEKDDWKARETWYKANPNLGLSVKEEFIAAQCKLAQELPSYENTFKRLHLNIWTKQDIRWIALDKWDACRGELEIQDGDECYAGLDLASTVDVAALALIFPMENGEFHIKPFFWVPEENALDRQRRGNVPYFDWIKQGHMIGTPGNAIDYGFIRKMLNDLSLKYLIKEVGFDPWNATQLAQQLEEEDGLTMVPIRQGFGSMSAPSKFFEGSVLSRKIVHDGNPVLRWMADNVAVEQDAAGNIKPSKKKSSEKIDGIVAIINGLARASLAMENDTVYNSRGIIVL